MALACPLHEFQFSVRETRVCKRKFARLVLLGRVSVFCSALILFVFLLIKKWHFSFRQTSVLVVSVYVVIFAVVWYVETSIMLIC